MPENKDTENRQTKAALMNESGSRNEDEKGLTTSESESGNTPTISKAKAERRESERPTH